MYTYYGIVEKQAALVSGRILCHHGMGRAGTGRAALQLRSCGQKLGQLKMLPVFPGEPSLSGMVEMLKAFLTFMALASCLKGECLA